MPLRPLALGELLDGALTTCRRHARTVFGLAAVLLALQAVIDLLLLLGSSEVIVELPRGTDPVDTLSFESSSLGSIPSALLGGVVQVLLAGVLTVIVSEAVLGRSIDARGVLRRLRPLAGGLAVVSLAAGVLPFVGLVFFVVPGVFLWGALALATPALVLERRGPGQALRRSWRLAVSSWWRVFGIRALAFIIASVVSSVLLLPFAVVGIVTAATADSPNVAGPIVAIVATLLGFVAQLVTAPFQACVLALLYIDRRMRAEGLDLSLRQAAAPTTGSGTADRPPGGRSP